MTDLLAGLCYIRDALFDDKVLCQLDKIASYDGTTFIHCVSVAQFSVVLGIHVELSDADLCILTKAALLHQTIALNSRFFRSLISVIFRSLISVLGIVVLSF